jgi:sugar O-acyltransferase (sialic acid O-acetyltransferase NeuD family)
MRVIIVGCGGHGREMAQLLMRMQAAGGDVSAGGFVDDNVALQGKTLSGLPVLGGMEWISANRHGCLFICAIGKPLDRRRVVERMDEMGVRWATLIAPDVHVPEDASIGAGSMICAGTHMTTNVRIGRHVIVNLDCTLSHDLIMGDFSTLSCGVHLAGNVTIGEGADLGLGVNIIPGVKIGAWSIIGAGATVIRDIPSHVTAVGVPARVIKEHK